MAAGEAARLHLSLKVLAEDAGLHTRRQVVSVQPQQTVLCNKSNNASNVSPAVILFSTVAF